jgi:hypothetical protein
MISRIGSGGSVLAYAPRHMRTILALSVLVTGCASSSVEGGGQSAPDSVRERLAAGPTRLFVGREGDSTGMVTAQRWTPGGWIAGDHTLVIEDGELEARVAPSGLLTLSSFEVAVAPIEIPEEVFKKPAQLTDVRVKLTTPAAGAAQWSGDDAATATLPLELDLEWAIAIDGGKTPLGEQHLPPIDVSFTVDGDGEYVHATLGLAASGELWNWAGLLELTRLELQLSAETVD